MKSQENENIEEHKLISIINEIQELNSLDGKNILQRIIKFNEEYGEMNAELCKYEGITQKPFDKDHLIEETADFLQNAFSIIFEICKTINISKEDIFLKMSEKNKKWRSKIPEYTINKQ